MNRTWVRLVVLPVVATGVLTGHWLAYRLTATPTEPLHAYLAHAPEVLLYLHGRGRCSSPRWVRPSNAPSVRTFPLVGLATFVVQEHLERLAHGGGLPMLLTSPAFVVGLALQIPVALVAWAVAHWLLGLVGDPVPPAPVCPDWDVVCATIPTANSIRSDVRIPPGRGPPRLLRYR